MKQVCFLVALVTLRLSAQDAPTAAPSRAEKASPRVWGRYFNTVGRADWRPLQGKERWHIYWRATYASPGTFFRAAGPALGDHLNDRPETWRQGMEGYSRRFANRFARFALQDLLSHASSAALDYEVRYVRCGCTGFPRRLGHALLWNFLTLDRNGQTVLNAPRIGSAFAAEFIGNAWMPDGYRTREEAFRGVGIQLGVGALFNTIREFAPRGKGR
ncbi:MAG: hypothetical protein ACUVS7_07190 [Bryobacteraceae bacterium]